ncbi:MAG: hypothetical protein K2K81_04435 [Muribaculaceae bacterium]|nr:hypothetical protein [Muribaculaceae bacterium]
MNTYTKYRRLIIISLIWLILSSLHIAEVLIGCGRFATVTASAQLNSYSVEKKKAIMPYDSLQNVPDIDKITSLTGQVIFFPENDYLTIKGGYEKSFYTCPTFSTLKHVLRTEDKTIYSPMSSHPLRTAYSAIANRKFKIDNITERSGYLDFCFELKEVDDDQAIIAGESIYMAYLPTNYDCPKFITLGYVEKQKKNFLNKNFLWSARNFILNIETGQEENPPAGTVFKCVDIALVNGHIEAIMENAKYGRFIGDLSQEKGKIFCFHEEKDYNRWVKLYGRVVASKMLQGKIYVGMTKKMVLASWGQPERINSLNISGKLKEQWIYPMSNRYLYFSGNKLTAIQDM